MITPCITYLLNKFSAIRDAGNLLDYFPADAKTGAIAKAAFVSDGDIKACIVRRTTAEEAGGHDNYSTFLHTLWIEVLRSYRGRPTQQACDAVLDALLTSFAQDEMLGGTVAERHPARLTISEPRFFYKYLCHYGLIELVVVTVP